MVVIKLAPVAPIESPAVAQATSTADFPPAKVAKAKATKAPKEKKAVTKKPSMHPTYLEMILEAIASQKERTGSSQYAISKFVEDKHKAHLPGNIKKLLLVQLRKLTAAGKLTKVKNSDKIHTKPVASGKKTTISTKPKLKTDVVKTKSTAVKPKGVAVKPKPKASAANLKVKATAAKPKTAAKLKSVTHMPKASGGLGKTAKNSAKAAPSATPKKAAPYPAKPKKAAAGNAKSSSKPKIVKKAPAVKKAKK